MSMNLILRHANELELARAAREGLDARLLRPAGAPAVPRGPRLERLAKTGGSIALVDRPSLDQTRQELRQKIEAQLDALRRSRPSGQTAVEPPSPSSPPPAPEPLPDRPMLDLGKSWHILHFVLTGQAWTGTMPAATLLAGGREIGRDLGYGPARASSPAETAAFARFLEALDVARLSSRLDMRKMARLGIYCVDSVDPGTLAGLRAELSRNFPRLTDFVGGAARSDDGMLMWMT
jgi:hypothetical protein